MAHRDGTEPVTRREALQRAAVATAALAAGGTPPAAASSQRPRRRAGPEVAVLGGGMAGLAAAHELVERGFRVAVYERKALGGKARSIPVPASASGGHRALRGARLPVLPRLLSPRPRQHAAHAVPA